MTNIWALKKQDAIRLLLLLLGESMDRHRYFITDVREQDYRSVRLCETDDPLVSAYVFMHGQADGRYGVHLEYPRHEGSNLSDTVMVRENLSGERIVEVLSVHFD